MYVGVLLIEFDVGTWTAHNISTRSHVDRAILSGAHGVDCQENNPLGTQEVVIYLISIAVRGLSHLYSWPKVLY